MIVRWRAVPEAGRSGEDLLGTGPFPGTLCGRHRLSCPVSQVRMLCGRTAVNHKR
jgi:hypothetical protein